MDGMSGNHSRSTVARRRWMLAAAIVVAMGVMGYLLLGPVLGPERASTDAHASSDLVRTTTSEASTVAPAPTTASATTREAAAKERTVAWSLRILDRATKQPVSRAHVSLRWTDSHADADSGDDGSVAIETEEHPNVDVIVDHPAYVPTSIPSTRAGELHDILLDRAGELKAVLRPTPSAPATVLLLEQVSDNANHWPVRRSETRDVASFARLPPGDYTLTAQLEGWIAPMLRSVRVRGGESREVVLDLVPASTLHGRLLLAESDTPVPGARVVLLAMRDSPPVADEAIAPTVTAADGRFEFRGLAAAQYKLYFTARDGLPSGGMFTVHRGEVLDQDFRTPPLMRLHGRTVDAEKRALSGATVALLSASEWIDALEHAARRLSPSDRPTATSRADGTFELSARYQNRNGMVFLVLAAPGAPLQPASSTWRNVDARSQAQADNDLDLGDVVVEASRTIHGRVKEESGAPVGGATVQVRSQYPDVVMIEVPTADDGSFSIDVCTESDGPMRFARMFARKEGYVCNRVFLNQKLADPLELVLHRARTVSGRVVDLDGRGVADLEIVLGTQLKEHGRGPNPGGGDAFTTTDASGHFQFVGVVAMESELTLARGVRKWKMQSRDPVTIPADGDTQASMVVASVEIVERASVRGRIVLPRSVPTISNLILRASPPKGDTDEADIFADAQGQGILAAEGEGFLLSNVTPGRRILNIVTNECVFVQQSITLMPGQTLDVGDIVLVRAAKITVRTIDADGKPAMDATVELVDGTNGKKRTLVKFKDAFATDDLSCGAHYDLVVHRTGHPDHVEGIDVPDQARFELSVHLE
jgi:hypothetical protein